MRSVCFNRFDRSVRPSVGNSLPPMFQCLSWSNLAAQCSEQISLAAAPLVAGARDTGQLQTAQILPFLLSEVASGDAEGGRDARISVTVVSARELDVPRIYSDGAGCSLA